jgi:hypothetical protein
MPAHGCPAVYSFASLLLHLLVSALVLENDQPEPHIRREADSIICRKVM